MPLLSVATQHYSTPHALWGCAVDLASALSAATVLADAAVTPTVYEVTYNVSSGSLNPTQPTNQTARNCVSAPVTLIYELAGMFTRR